MDERVEPLAEVKARGRTTRFNRRGDRYEWVTVWPEERLIHEMTLRRFKLEMGEGILREDELECLALASEKDTALVPAYKVALKMGKKHVRCDVVQLRPRDE